ncbi:MAG: endonuclease/exonuclease/phosphatase family protein [Chloroflexi bacterium]|nr:endonuclease/exonuclease/phosphatase family protein [Chloroflexota bacterium]MCI0643555.1 endonuclease/exonuclease/phosphatase family protein [Chloroflexota bacterium]
MLPVRVVAYNLWFGGRDRLDDIYAVLAHLNADFIGLTEADDPDVVAELARRLGLGQVWARGSGDRHIAALTRFPVSHWQVHNRRPLTQAVLETTLDLGQAAGSLTIYTAHFLPLLLLPFEIRRWQAAGRLLAVIQERQPGRHLLIGDFNSIAPGDRVLQRRNPARMRRLMALQFGLIFRLAIPRLLRAGYVDCFRHLHPDDDGFTWWTINPTTRFDYILAPANLLPSLRTCQVVVDAPDVAKASDHFPLLAAFDFATGN